MRMRSNILKNEIDETEENLVDVHFVFETGNVLDLYEINMREIMVDKGRFMTIPEGDATAAHTINLDKVEYITYSGENYK